MIMQPFQSCSLEQKTELSSKREHCPFRKKSYQWIQMVWCYDAFHSTLVEWVTHCSKSHRLKNIAVSKSLTDTLVLKEVCALCALCTGNYNFYALFFFIFHVHMYVSYLLLATIQKMRREIYATGIRSHMLRVSQWANIFSSNSILVFVQIHFLLLISTKLCQYFCTYLGKSSFKTLSVDFVWGFFCILILQWIFFQRLIASFVNHVWWPTRPSVIGIKEKMTKKTLTNW